MQKYHVEQHVEKANMQVPNSCLLPEEAAGESQLSKKKLWHW